MRTLVIVLAVLAIAAAAGAQTTMVWFYGLGGGDFMDSPPVITGTMDPSGDITDGSWTIVVPDTGWPTDPAVRYQYIWDNFFASNYVAGTGGSPGYWVGYIDSAHGLPEENSWDLVDDTNDGTMTGYATIQILVDDLDNDQELDEGEFCSGSLTGGIIVVREGTGAYDGMCGTGNYFGTYVKDCPGTYETWNFGMYLYLEDCSTPVENTSWGVIKALYN